MGEPARAGAEALKLRPPVPRGQPHSPARPRLGSATAIGYRVGPPKTPMTPTLFPLLLLLQDGAAAPAGTQSAPSPLAGPMIPLLIVVVLFVFMLILPERKKQKQRQQMLAALKKGDRVLTTSGIYGTVVTTSNDVIVLQVADNVRLRFARVAIQVVLPDEKEAGEKREEKAEASKA